jgi:hypothetical protein
MLSTRVLSNKKVSDYSVDGRWWAMSTLLPDCSNYQSQYLVSLSVIIIWDVYIRTITN